MRVTYRVVCCTVVCVIFVTLCNGQCSQPDIDGQLFYGRVSFDHLNEGGVAQYTCDPGYSSSSGNTQRTCLSGSWTGLPPVCTLQGLEWTFHDTLATVPSERTIKVHQGHFSVSRRLDADGSTAPGKLWYANDGQYYTSNDTAMYITEYSGYVLEVAGRNDSTVGPQVFWLAGEANDIPAHAVVGGQTVTGVPRFSIRGYINGTPNPGYYTLGDTGAYHAWDGNYLPDSHFDYLIAFNERIYIDTRLPLQARPELDMETVYQLIDNDNATCLDVTNMRLDATHILLKLQTMLATNSDVEVVTNGMMQDKHAVMVYTTAASAGETSCGESGPLCALKSRVMTESKTTFIFSCTCPDNNCTVNLQLRLGVKHQQSMRIHVCTFRFMY